MRPASRRSLKGKADKDKDVKMTDDDDVVSESSEKKIRDTSKPESDSDEESDDQQDGDTNNDDDPFAGSFLARPGAATLTSTLRALTGMISGQSSRLRTILTNLKQKEDSSLHLVALQELSEILLVSNEDNLSGHFSPDQYVKELVALMQPNEFGEENPEIMLLACRCIANMMEALPASTSNVVYGGAVPILCQKLLEINFIDLAEQSLSVSFSAVLLASFSILIVRQTLEKISSEFPSSIVREGGLTACLTYLDFFPTSTQRTAVTIAANCCRNIPEDSFSVVRDVMPILLNVLSSSDQRVVEQGCICVSRIVESFRYEEGKLEQLISPEILKAMLRLLFPGSTSLIKPNIQTQFLRVLAITARASPRLSVELFKLNVVDTLYQILTGVSPPSESKITSPKMDSVVVMQALIHRPAEQILETLNVISEVLPNMSRSTLVASNELDVISHATMDIGSGLYTQTNSSERLELLQDCEQELRRFAIILFPALTDAYSSTVNLSVRQKVLTAQLKMLSNLSTGILTEALRPIAYASHLASILWQQDHPTLVVFALQAAELLQKRLTTIYQDQFHREGVISEVSRLASRPHKVESKKADQTSKSNDSEDKKSSGRERSSSANGSTDTDGDGCNSEPGDGEDDGDNADEAEEHTDLDSSSASYENISPQGTASDLQDMVTLRAKRFMDANETGAVEVGQDKANIILEDLKSLAVEIKQYKEDIGDLDERYSSFSKLARFFTDDALRGITSYELLSSGIVDALLQTLAQKSDSGVSKSELAFRKAFMEINVSEEGRNTKNASISTPFGILIAKLQDLLSRAEHFEVITVHQSPFDSYRGSAASNLAKQLRLRLVAEDGSEIPRPYRNVMVSIHAIATFKALDDYLRPRMSLADKTKSSRSRDDVSSTIAAYAAALAHRTDSDSPFSASKISLKTSTDNTYRSDSKRQTSQELPKMATPAHSSSSNSTELKSETENPIWRSIKEDSTPDLPPPPPLHPDDEPHRTLECADETQLSDEEDAGDDGGLNAIVDDLEDEIENDLPDPSAVDVEVASTGKVIAREKDGTRIATPSHTSTSSVSASLSKVTSASHGQHTPPSSSKPMSYATAVQSIPQDWHIEFSVNGQPLSSNTTIYQAVHFNQSPEADVSTRSIWSAIHTIKFKRVAGPPPSLQKPADSSINATSSRNPELPQSLSKDSTAASILKLLSILYDVNGVIERVIPEDGNPIEPKPESLSQFVNTKLTAKLNRQLEEPLIVASNCLPTWSEDLARLYPFVFPFESRHLFLQSTSFGYSRSMARWQNAQSSSSSRHDRHRDERPFLGRLQRQKVRISRSRILESAIKVMELYGSSPSVLEVEYFEEVGTGLGPTLEFFSNVSKEFCKKKLKLWRDSESSDDREYAFAKQGLFPAPMSEAQAESENGKRILHLFKMLGKFIARSMLDSRMVDVTFNPNFFRIGVGIDANLSSIGAVYSIDEGVGKAMNQLRECAIEKKRIDEDDYLTQDQKKYAIQAIEYQGSRIEDLGLDFTLPGYPTIEMIPDGEKITVTVENVGQYVDKVIDYTLFCGVQKQIEAFQNGFSQVFPYASLKAFTPDELVMLFGRVDEDWTLESRYYEDELVTIGLHLMSQPC